mmetsp:Transcript_24828/g.52620  ORF Transcript_24828/g.52620 Transcript_24828/m.52620 type:complete len:432 (+) Transcript_24828:163-1458(+)|eukprot:CAMPEP_0183712846 /NCGR_PEP_ID=MMETSP0737-20130205/7903_1 /TAXON_ID=385413 /ORGANISM="Thalassiosira miniscula, Strain CCMP1093" /LENGTH=431 /DNA_ID=CAMNT_0025941563 /DNA_START=37 /DNA_END=1332 /DNA_ORIENTATION=+
MNAMNMKMKTGLFLLQSVASSAFRSGGRGSSSCTTTIRRWSNQISSASSKSPSPYIHAGSGVAFLSTFAMLGGGSTVALCSSSNDDTDESRVATATATIAKKSIDEPDNTPTHNPMLPFPESSLRHDTYNGVTVDLTTITNQHQSSVSLDDADAFSDMLSKSLEIWTDEKRKGIWLKVPTTHSHLITPATQRHGFDFQHAEPGYCVLTKWLPKDSQSRLPNGPTHQVGIGALVLHPTTGKMLAVQERTGPAAKRKLWKMPTGLTDPGEDIATAAVRELKEETGLDCIFDRIICFRQAHGGLFNRSDMFFVCLCKLTPEQEENVKQGGEVELLPQEEEILMADWIDMEDYAQQMVWRESPLYKEMNGAMIKAAKKGITYSTSSSSGDVASDCTLNGEDGGEEDDDESHGFVAKNLPVGFRPGKNTIYVSSKL